MLTATLHPYQGPGVDLFLRRYQALFAMGTGTGKTVCSIAAAEELLGCGDISTVLVVCPASLKYQWARAISQFTDIPSKKITVKKQTIIIPRAPHGIVIDGKAYQKNGVRYSAADDRKRQYESVSSQTDYVIVGYDNIVDDSRAIRKIKPGLVILDEATAIKNPGAQITQYVKQILQPEYKLALTATPIENALEELFFILEWVDPEFLGPWEYFEKAYIVRDGNGRIVRYKNTDVLFGKLKEIMYRKTREDPDVAPYMPEPEWDEWVVELDPVTWAMYTDIAMDLLAELRAMPKTQRFDPAAFYAGQGEMTAAGRAMAIYQAASMLLDHPRLVEISAQQYSESLEQQRRGVEKKNWPGSEYAHKIWDYGLLNECMSFSPKIYLLVENVTRILREDPDAKVVIFTQWRPLLNIIAGALGIRCAQYHGEMTPRQKEASVAQFANEQGCRVFLSSHAGAYGRDLYMANHLVNVDWAPSAGRAEQIDGRHVRASSEFANVFIHNMIVEGTIEERDRERMGFKKDVGRAVLDGKGARRGVVHNRVESLTKFLERTVEARLDSVRP